MTAARQALRMTLRIVALALTQRELQQSAEQMNEMEVLRLLMEAPRLQQQCR